MDTYVVISGGWPQIAGSARQCDQFVGLAPCPWATLSLHFEDGTSTSRRLSLTGRTTVSVASMFPEAADRRFGITVESGSYCTYVATGRLECVKAGLVVERSMYWGGLGRTWEAGTNTLGMPW